jgi:cellulose synthase/poly-beta-1,6-N-acetylglucosamine synthase-like glycosyltransferase
MSPFETAILGLYFVTLVILAVFGLHRYVMVYLYLRYKDRRALPAPLPAKLPRVTIQLPLFNEMYVVDRLLESVSKVRYPRDLLEIQVLDDSTDETAAIASAAAERYREQGLDIQYLHRDDRRGFKAGALEEGLRAAKGEFVLIFDADFVAPPDILEKTLGHFQDPGVGMVQVRWGHVNRDYSLLTQVQSVLLDGHFVLEHGGRNRAGRFFNFNGTAGVWRREAIVDAGGWQHDTLTEDLDLSYRAQMRGWRFVFVQDVVSPAEIPVEMNSFKSQQHRWAKGSVQTCKKLLPSILAAGLPLPVKIEAAFHLTANFAYPLMVLLSVLMFPAMVIRYNMGWYEMMIVDVPLFLGATMSVCSFYLLSQREVFGDGWRGRLKYLPAVLAVGIGLSVTIPSSRARRSTVWRARPTTGGTSATAAP